MALKIRLAAYKTSVLILPVTLVLMVLTSCGGIGPTIESYNMPPSNVNNTVPVTVGANLAGFPNAVFTSVTVCPPAVYPAGQNLLGGPYPIQPCQTIDNILVDTGSVGLRLLDSAAVDDLQLPVVTDSNSNALHECVQFADLSYVWGTVARATIQMAGETASQVPFIYDPNNPGQVDTEIPNTGIPIQIITSPIFPPTPVPENCLSSHLTGGTLVAANTLQTLGANGILGVGSFLQDCGSACTSTPPRNQYYYCPSNLCSVASVPLDLQLWNPLAAFAYDNNGLLLTLPFPKNGASGPITGSLIFGNGTQSDSALGQANIFSIDAYGNFPEVALTEPSPIDPSFPPALFVSYLSPQNGSYLDTGSPAIYFSDAQSLAVPECLDTNGKPLGLYCPTSQILFSGQVYGANKVRQTIYWPLDNAAPLLNSGNSVLSTLGGDSGIDSATDYADFGLPFFLGKKVFVGFAGATAYDPQGQLITYPNGYWAF
jgi:hypothetical protein